MSSRYLQTNSDVENGSAWSKGSIGGVAKATFWESMDGDSGTWPPTPDEDISFALASNASLPGANPYLVRVRFEALSGSPLPVPHKSGGQYLKWRWKRNGTGSFASWPTVQLWNDGVMISGASWAQTDPGTSYRDVTITIPDAVADLIDWTKSLDVVFTDPVAGSGTCRCRITTAWYELPGAWSIEASGSSQSDGLVEPMLTNIVSSGSSQSDGFCELLVIVTNGVASGSSQSDGSATLTLINIVASGSSQSDGYCLVASTNSGVASGSSQSDGFAEVTITYPPGIGTGSSPRGGVVAGKGA